MAYTSTQLADLRAAIAEGVLTVRFSDGRQLTYRSLDEMLQLERKISSEVEATATMVAKRIYTSFQRA